MELRQIRTAQLEDGRGWYEDGGRTAYVVSGYVQDAAPKVYAPAVYVAACIERMEATPYDLGYDHLVVLEWAGASHFQMTWLVEITAKALEKRARPSGSPDLAAAPLALPEDEDADTAR